MGWRDDTATGAVGGIDQEQSPHVSGLFQRGPRRPSGHLDLRVRFAQFRITTQMSAAFRHTNSPRREPGGGMACFPVIPYASLLPADSR
jgi:hypothetical protein